VDEQGELNESDRRHEQQRERDRCFYHALTALPGTPASDRASEDDPHRPPPPSPERRPRMFWKTVAIPPPRAWTAAMATIAISAARMAYSTIDWPGEPLLRSDLRGAFVAVA